MYNTINFENSNYNIVFKANNTSHFNNVLHNYDNIKYDFKSSIKDLLYDAKLIILDSPSTTLIEACSTKIPIFVLGGRCDYNNKFIELIKKRVVWCDDLVSLTKELDLYLKSDIYNANLNSIDFLKNYSCLDSQDKVYENLELNLKKIINY